MRYLIVVLCATIVAGHYGKPPCLSDENPTSIAGTGGTICTPKCGPGDACPGDVPPGDKVKPHCALNGPDGEKYCALTCILGKCPDGATCKWPAGAIVGYCVYPRNSSSVIRDVAIARNEDLESNQQVDPRISGLAWDIGVACGQVCQPDPDYSKTAWCKHKDRGGCCVEVNPSWDNVPGYKHMQDFCDKLCMPDGPGTLAMCKPPDEFKHLTAVDPLGAIDKFYGMHPEECSGRIGEWDEPSCKKAVVV